MKKYSRLLIVLFVCHLRAQAGTSTVAVSPCPAGPPSVIDWNNTESEDAIDEQLAAIETVASAPTTIKYPDTGPWSFNRSFGGPIGCVFVLAPFHNTVPYAADDRFGHPADYSGSIAASALSLSIQAPGVYLVAVYLSGSSVPQGYYLEAGALRKVTAGDGECSDTRWYTTQDLSGWFAGNKLPLIANDGTDAMNKTKAKSPYGQPGEWWDDTAGAIASIKAAYNANQKQPIDLILSGHGRPGSMSLPKKTGLESLSALGIGTTGDQVSTLVAGVKGMVSSIVFDSCCLGAGFAQAEEAVQRGHVLYRLSAGLGGITVTGWNQTMYYTESVLYRNPWVSAKKPRLGVVSAISVTVN
jgi:hypothetical protein